MWLIRHDSRIPRRPEHPGSFVHPAPGREDAVKEAQLRSGQFGPDQPEPGAEEKGQRIEGKRVGSRRSKVQVVLGDRSSFLFSVIPPIIGMLKASVFNDKTD